MIRRLLERRRFGREHRWTHARLSEYLDRELDERDRERIDAHVSACPQCHRVLATLRRTVRALRELSSRPEPTIADGVIERLRAED